MVSAPMSAARAGAPARLPAVPMCIPSFITLLYAGGPDEGRAAMTAFDDSTAELSLLLMQRWTILREEPPGAARLPKLHELDPLIVQQAKAMVKDVPLPGKISRHQR